MRLRIGISAAIGIVSGVFCWCFFHRFTGNPIDFIWAVRAARDLLSHRNPYDTYMQLYPLPVALFGLPFVWMSPAAAAGAFYGSSSALLAFCLTRYGYHRLLIFLAYPYWAALLVGQWSPLLMAAALLPWLLPATLAKPQIGLPIALTHFTWRGALACAIVLLASLVVMPSWPRFWIHQLPLYDHFYPLLVLPGPLLALAALRYRDRDAWYLLLMAVTPQRWFYDAFVLWLITKSRREIIWTVFLSWFAGVWRWYHAPHSVVQVGRWTVLFVYLPMLAVILLRMRKSQTTRLATVSEAGPAATRDS